MRNQFLQGLLLTACSLTLFSLTACSRGNAADTVPPATSGVIEEPGILVEVSTVSTTPMNALYSTSATLDASQQAMVSARARGVLERLLVDEGSRVRAEQPLAELENAEQKIAAERAHAMLATARWDFERTEKLFAQELVSEEVFETARRDLTDAEQSAALADLELSRTIIRAPFSGTVLKRHLDVGNTVSDGTTIFELADTGELWAEVNVPERQIARLELGQVVQLAADAADAEVEAVIERIAPRVDTDTGTVRVTVAVDGRVAEKSGLRPGSFVRVDVVTDTRPEALVVPREALLAEGRRWVVYRVDESGESVEQVEIKIGFESPEWVEITGVADPDQAPLLLGQTIVTAGVGALSDEARIQIANEPGTESVDEKAQEFDQAD